MLRLVHPSRRSLATGSMALLVLVIGLGVSVQLHLVRTHDARRQQALALQNIANETTETLERRFLSYELMIQAAKGLLVTDEEVTRDEWAEFSRVMGIGEHDNGVYGIALVRAVRDTDLPDYEDRVRAQGVPDFAATGPDGAPVDRSIETHYIIENSVPVAANRSTWGLDIADVPVNRKAYQAACDTGRAWLTSAFQLAQQDEGELGVVLVLPVYRGGVTPSTVEERRQRIDCFVALPIGLDRFMGDLAERYVETCHLRFEGIAGQGEWSTLYERPGHDPIPNELFAVSHPILPGQRWSVIAIEYPEPTEAGLARIDPGLMAGILISSLLATLVWFGTRTRRRAETLAERMTRSLRESESRYRSLVDGAPVCIKELDREGRIVSINPAGVAMAEKQAESELQGLLLTDAVIPEDRDVVRKNLEGVLAGETRAFQYSFRPESGGLVTLETLIVPRRCKGNEVCCMICVSSDVTERVRAENRIKENEARLENLTRLAPIGIYRANADGLVVDVSERLTELTGLTRELACRHDWSSFIHPDDYAEVVERWDRMVAEHVEFDSEYRLRRPDGEWAWFHVQAVPERDAQGNVTGFVGSMADHTERWAAEDLLRQNEARLMNLTRLAPVGIFRADAEGTLVDVSERLVELTGMTREEMCSEDWSPFMHPDDYQPVVDAWHRLIDHQTTYDVEYRLRRPDGSWAWFHVQAVPERDEEGNITGFVGSMADHTERRAFEEELRRNEARLRDLAEQAQAANRVKGEFLANMSHEIRTPMTAILGFAELLSHSVEPGTEAEDALLTIQRNGEHLLQIVNDVLNISKIEAGQLAVSHSNIDTRDLVGQIFRLLSQKAQARNTTLLLQPADDAPPVIATDPVRLRQVLLNLVGNAIKFTRDGTVRVVTSNGDTPGTVVIEVIDTGIGLDPARIEQIFEPFVQGDSTTTRNYGGTGLGLSVSRKIAEALGGTLTADPDHRGGSRFVLTLRDAAPIENEAPATETAAAAPSLATDNRPRRVLLAEDSTDSQRLIAHHLRQAGHEVVTAEDGDRAVEFALDAQRRGQPFDLILMDMQMPRLDGYGATAKLRSRGYTGRIVALTAHAMDFEKQRCLDAGCDDYATKPIPRQTLLDLIRTRRNAA